MPNWPASRLSNEDEFVLRPILIVRSQWSTQEVGGSRIHPTPTLREKRRGREAGFEIRGGGRNEEIESALTNLELTLYRYPRPTFDPRDRVPLAPSCFGVSCAPCLQWRGTIFAGEEEEDAHGTMAHKTHRG